MTDARPTSNTVSTRLLVLVAGMLFVVTTLVHYHGLIASADQYDDSYITYRCAVNLADGRGLAFNAGERTSCASSLLYAALLAALDRVEVALAERPQLRVRHDAALLAAASRRRVERLHSTAERDAGDPLLARVQILAMRSIIQMRSELAMGPALQGDPTCSRPAA